MKLSDPLKPGEVALVGAGPGDRDLLTVAGFSNEGSTIPFFRHELDIALTMV